MTPDTYTFTGDATTFIGMVGVISTGIIILTAFRRFFNSDYNTRYVKPVEKDGMEPWGHSDLEYLIQNNITDETDESA
jgi:hypothetical protein